MHKRTFSISHITLDNLREMSSLCGINIATISRMAVKHGIERIENGYLPVRDRHKKIKQKFEIELPQTTWTDFKKAMNSIKYQLEEHIPDGEMVELFLNIELRKFINLYDEYEEQAKHGKVYRDEESKNVFVELEMPILLYDRLEEIHKKTHIKQTQLGKYLLLSGSIQEYFISMYNTVDTDVDLLNEINILGLDRLKALTLIKYLIENNRIVWKSRG